MASNFLFIVRSQSSASSGLLDPANVGGLSLRKIFHFVLRSSTIWVLVLKASGEDLNESGLVGQNLG
jgi:hypothetical protein